MRLGAFNCSHLEFNLSKRVYRDHRTSVGGQQDNRTVQSKKETSGELAKSLPLFIVETAQNSLSCHDLTGDALRMTVA
jgi:hypothetical protein